jgi:hypothetical protein
MCKIVSGKFPGGKFLSASLNLLTLSRQLTGASDFRVNTTKYSY